MTPRALFAASAMAALLLPAPALAGQLTSFPHIGSEPGLRAAETSVSA